MAFSPTYAPASIQICRRCHWCGVVDASNAIYVLINGEYVPDFTKCPADGSPLTPEEDDRHA